MKTQKIFALFGIILALWLFQSCEKFLEVEPQQAVSDDTVYGNHEGVQNAINGAWERIAGPQLFAGTSIFHSDLVANEGDLNWLGTFIEYRQMNWKSFDPNGGDIAGKWIRAYHAIDLANNVLASLSVVRESEKDRIEGEAHFIRGIIYFELVRFYALPFVKGEPNTHDGVPLVLTPTNGINESSYPSRATVAAVYASILSDLGTAKTKLAAFTASGANGGRATASAAAAFMVRVHMAMEEWQLAAQEATFVIDNFGGYTALNNNPRAAFNNDDYTSEDVFMILQDALSNAGQANAGITTFFASLRGLGRGDVAITNLHMTRYEAGDLRATYVEDPGIVGIADVPTMFYKGVGTRPNNRNSSKWGKHDANIQVIRLAEMILSRAEANFRNSSSIGAEPLADIMAIRNRANASQWESITLDLIREERFRELCFEGHALHDLRRFRRSVVAPAGSPHVGQTIEWNDGRLVLPIPQREMNVNPNLTQNSAYN
jgi:starch-binding outer membrane protein, SusD/RagB family